MKKILFFGAMVALPDGERVPTGIYNIYAAQGGQPSVTGTPQTTVMVIK